MADPGSSLGPISDAFNQWREDIAERYRKFVWPSPPQWFSVITVAALLVWVFTRQSPSVLVAMLNYFSIVTACCAFVAAFTTKWFDWPTFWKAAVPLSVVALLVNGWYDQYTVGQVIQSGSDRSAEQGGDGRLVVQFDTYHRWTGRHLFQAVESTERMGKRRVRWRVVQGPMDSESRRHGPWTDTQRVPRGGTMELWYFHGEELPRSVWHTRMEEAGEPIPDKP